jgi:hypothetical protein
MAEVKAVEFRAELRQIKTMVDHSTNITLNIPEDCREQVKVMLDWLADEVGVVMVANGIDKGESNDRQTRRKR